MFAARPAGDVLLEYGDYQGLRTVTGDSGRANSFLPSDRQPP
jgi:hypothetical protein